MGQVLRDLKEDKDCRHCVRRIFVKHISEQLFKHLTDRSAPAPTLLERNLFDHLNSELSSLRRIYGEGVVNTRVWQRFPLFHGVVYGEYHSYAAWEVDGQGILTHRTRCKFMHRTFDPALFNSHEIALREGFVV